VIRRAVKFEFAGGLAVTQYFDYKVGDDCSGDVLANSSDSMFANQALKFYPNPVQNECFIEKLEGQSLEISLVTDLQGKSYSVPMIQTKSHYQLTLSGLKAGLYFITIVNGENERSVIKVLKD
jgi:endo-1,3(4)-beta-glucanase